MQLFDALADLSEWFKLLVHFVQSIEKEKTRLLGQPGAKTKRMMYFWFLLIVRRQCHQCRCPEVSNVDKKCSIWRLKENAGKRVIC